MKTILDYADLVKEQHALNTIIAPVETDLTSASKAYAVGQKFVYDGVLYQAKTAIAQGAALVLNTNYEAADDVSTEIEALTNNLSDEVEVRAKLGAHNLVDIDGFTLIKSSARTKYIYPSDIIHGAIPSEQVVISFKVTNSNLSKSNNYFKAYGSGGEIGAVSFQANGRYSFVFDGTSFSNFYIFISSDAESDETCTISEIMITLATDAYSEYTPYAKTNQELTAENQTLTNEVDTIVNDLSAKNIFNIEKWLTTAGLTYTKNGDTYTTSTGGTSYSSPFSFADADIDIVISGILTNITSSYARIEVLNSSDNVVATINEGTTSASGKGCKIRLNYSTAGNFSIEKPMIRDASIKNADYAPYAMTNRELTGILLPLNGYMIQVGSVEIGRAVGLNTAQVTFPRAFADAGNTRIWVTYDTSQPNNWIPGRTGVTRTGFTAELYNATDSPASSTSVQWLAIGKQA